MHIVDKDGEKQLVPDMSQVMKFTGLEAPPIGGVYVSKEMLKSPTQQVIPQIEQKETWEI